MGIRIFATLFLVALFAPPPIANGQTANGGWNDPTSNQFHIQTDEGPERYFRYQTESGQYRKEKRLEDGTVVGSYGWIDSNGFLRLEDYIADNAGYRILRTKNVYVGRNRPISQAIKAAKKVPSAAGILTNTKTNYSPPKTTYPATQTYPATYPATQTYPSTQSYPATYAQNTYPQTFTNPQVDVSHNSYPSTTPSPLSSTISPPYPASTTVSPPYSVSTTSSSSYPTTTPTPVTTPATPTTPNYISQESPSTTPAPNAYTPFQSEPSPFSPPTYQTTPSTPVATPSPQTVYITQPTPQTLYYQSSTLPPPINSNSLDYYQQYDTNPYIHQNGPTYPLDRNGNPFHGYNNLGNGYDPQYPTYDGISVTNDGFRYYIPRAYHEEQNTGEKKSGSFGYIDPFGIRRVIYYNAGPNGFEHRKNNRYVGFDATPYDPRPYE